MNLFRMQSMSPQQRWLLIGFAFITGLSLALALVGGARAYTPVPFWDMWNGTIDFYLRLQSGDIHGWWAQHNEHRIILSRLLFWIDITLFKGTGAFLIVMNYLLAALAVVVFIQIGRDRWRSLDPAPQPDQAWYGWLLTMLLAVWLFHWMQHENFEWAFQSQFFLAQLVPLCALYAIARATGDDLQSSRRWFAGACVLGVLAAGTMANGIITLPLLTVYALLTRQGVVRTGILLALTLVVLSRYFSNYVSPDYHGSLSEAILTQPVALIEYVFLYLGSPLFNLLGRGDVGRLTALVASGLMAAVSLSLLVVYVIRGARQHALPLAMIFYIAYIAGTALGTGGGRLIFGVEQAVSSRYTTPALMAWAALSIVMLPGAWRVFRERQTAAVMLMSVFLLVMFYRQGGAINQRYQMKHDRMLAGMALELGVYDERQINYIFPVAETLHERVDTISAQNLTIFGLFPWADRREQLGEVYVPEPLPACVGYLDRVEPVESDPAYYRVHGWLLDSETNKVPTLITIINTASEVAGFALGGQPRDDVRAAIGRHARISGFRGYIHADSLNEPARLVVTDPACQLQLDIPASGTILAPGVNS